MEKFSIEDNEPKSELTAQDKKFIKIYERAREYQRINKLKSLSKALYTVLELNPDTKGSVNETYNDVIIAVKKARRITNKDEQKGSLVDDPNFIDYILEKIFDLCSITGMPWRIAQDKIILGYEKGSNIYHLSEYEITKLKDKIKYYMYKSGYEVKEKEYIRTQEQKGRDERAKEELRQKRVKELQEAVNKNQQLLREGREREGQIEKRQKFEQMDFDLSEETELDLGDLE
jgi:hypothetical protein